MGERDLDLPAMRKLATGTLIALAAVYLLTFLPADPAWPVKLLRAAAGAGIVGALADWFAVVALFRHPMGLPIPHTALLPRNQQRVAVNVARFIEENFLQADLIVSKLRDSELPARLAHWILREGQSEYLIRSMVNGAARILRADMPNEIFQTLSKLIHRLAEDASHNPKVARELSNLLQHGLKGDTLTDIVDFLRETVNQNRSTVARLVGDNSRWWIASRLDRNASELIVNGVISVLDDLAKPDSKLRADFEDALGGVLKDLATAEHLQHIIESSAAEYTKTSGFEDNLRDLILGLKNKLADYLESDEAVAAINTSLRQAAERLEGDADLQRRAEDTIADLVERMLPEARPHIGSFIAQTISNWDPELLVERFETEAGRDLQFIRINGALLGFAIGGVLFSIEHLIG